MAEFILDYGSPDGTRVYHNLDSFTQGYIQAMFFTDTGTGDDEDLEDANFTELAPDTLAKVIADCERFQRVTVGLFLHMNPEMEMEAGRDFWFTRNGHGVGFWDGDWSEDVAETLTATSKTFRSLDLYRGDDGQLYLA